MFLHFDYRILTSFYIDRVVSAKIPEGDLDLDYYNVIKKFMIHGPCGIADMNALCLVKGKCTKHFPKNFYKETTLEYDGFLVCK